MRYYQATPMIELLSVLASPLAAAIAYAAGRIVQRNRDDGHIDAARPRPRLRPASRPETYGSRSGRGGATVIRSMRIVAPRSTSIVCSSRCASRTPAMIPAPCSKKPITLFLGYQRRWAADRRRSG